MQQQQMATLALAAACLCLTANGAMISKRGLSESQMQYGGRPVDPSDTEETSTSTGPAWPVGSVPGMNIFDIYSYENAHNFNLQPSSRRSSPASPVKRSAQIPEDLPPNEPPTEDLPPSESLTTDLAPEETLITTDLLPHEVMASIISPTPAAANLSSPSGTDAIPTAASPDTTPPAVLIRRTDVYWPWQVITGTLADGEIVPHVGVCKSDFIGDWAPGKKRSNNIMTAAKLGAQDIVERYLPYLDLRAAMKHNEAVKRATLPFGVAAVSQSVTVYTDMGAYRMAVVSWYNARTGVDNVCGDATPPLFRITTKVGTTTTKTSRAQDSVTRKLSNANANLKFSKPAGGNTLNYKRGVDDGRKEPARVDAGTVTRAVEWGARGTGSVSPAPWTA